jgi:hypothetical protein
MIVLSYTLYIVVVQEGSGLVWSGHDENSALRVRDSWLAIVIVWRVDQIQM